MPPPQAVCRQSTVTRASRSKARLLDEPNRRGSWRSHVHCTYIAQRVQLFKIETGNVTFLLGVQGGFSFEKENPPLIRAAPPALPYPHCAVRRKQKEGRAFAQPPSYAGLAAAAVIAATAIVAAAATAAAAAGEDQDDEDQDPQAAAAAKTTVIIAHKTNPL